MSRKLKNIISFLLVLILLAPSIIKIVHHHEHEECCQSNEKGIHTFHEKCCVCSFEYSFFIAKNTELTTEKSDYSNSYICGFYNFQYSNLFQYSFLLRAPPVFTNSKNII